jgi:hypothetical protein
MECKYEGRKPSLKQILALVAQANKQGETLLEISWGENSITLENEAGQWHGWGWIREIGGSDIAQQLNTPPANK